MTNKNVIEIIDRLMDSDADKIIYNSTEVFTTIVHGYYYIRPGKDTDSFLKKINRVLKDCHKAENRKHSEMKEGIPFEAWLLGKMASNMIAVARSMFDVEYYNSQVARMVMHERYDDSLLERYLYWLDGSELKSVFEGLLVFKRDFDIFISDINLDIMFDELKECSLISVKNSPLYMKDYDKHIDYIENSWDFCFEYMTREAITNIICKYANEDSVMLASMIKTFKYSDVHTSAGLTVLAAYFEKAYELDVFNPVITDMSKIHLEDYDYRHSKVIYSNKSGKIMLA